MYSFVKINNSFFNLNFIESIVVSDTTDELSGMLDISITNDAGEVVVMYVDDEEAYRVSQDMEEACIR